MNPKHFLWHVEGKVGVITLNRPERKNPLTFDSYAELRDHFRALGRAPSVRAVVLRGEGGNFCSGGDVHEIIGPLTKMTMPQLLEFTRMTGDVVKAMRHCPQPLIAAQQTNAASPIPTCNLRPGIVLISLRFVTTHLLTTHLLTPP